MVSPWMTMENATTPKVATTIASRSGTVCGSDNASASARAPRNPPHQSTCCSAIEIDLLECINSKQSGYTETPRLSSTMQMTAKIGIVHMVSNGIDATEIPISGKIRELARKAANSQTP